MFLLHLDPIVLPPLPKPRFLPDRTPAFTHVMSIHQARKTENAGQRSYRNHTELELLGLPRRHREALSASSQALTGGVFETLKHMVGVGNATPQAREVRHPPTEGHKLPFINAPDQQKNGDDIPPLCLSCKRDTSGA